MVDDLSRVAISLNRKKEETREFHLNTITNTFMKSLNINFRLFSYS